VIIIIDVYSVILKSQLFSRGYWSYLIIIIDVCTLCSGFFPPNWALPKFHYRKSNEITEFQYGSTKVTDPQDKNKVPTIESNKASS